MALGVSPQNTATTRCLLLTDVLPTGEGEVVVAFASDLPASWSVLGELTKLSEKGFIEFLPPNTRARAREYLWRPAKIRNCNVFENPKAKAEQPGKEMEA